MLCHAVPLPCCAVLCCCYLLCSVLTIEPVPVFRAFMEYSAARNHLTSLIELLPAVVALDTTRTYTVNAPLIAGGLGWSCCCLRVVMP